MNENDELTISPEEDDNSDFLSKNKQREIYSTLLDEKISSLHADSIRHRLILQPDFQRHYVWDNRKASRLIESALMGIPIPVVYLAEEESKNGKKSVVIDGQQRLQSFFNFIENKFSLSGLSVYPELQGKKFNELIPLYQDRILDCSIRTITIKEGANGDLKFNVFERLNTGAVALNEQELRNCIYRGSYNNLLKELSQDPDFRFILGIGKTERRMLDVQHVLRFAAFYNHTYLQYRSPMKRFLNDDMRENRDISVEKQEKIRKAFKNSVSLVKSMLGERAFRRYQPGGDTNPTGNWDTKQFNSSLYDILMYCFADADKNLIMRNLDAIREAYIELMTTDRDFIDSITKATSDQQMVVRRFDKWRMKLDDVLKHDTNQPRCYSREFKQQLFEQSPICSICGQLISDIDDAAVDHIKQYWQGGSTTEDNARLTHRYCNISRRKHDDGSDT